MGCGGGGGVAWEVDLGKFVSAKCKVSFGAGPGQSGGWDRFRK